MKASFLLGSGASVPACFPTVGEITKHVYSELSESNSALTAHGIISNDVGRLLRWLEIQIKLRYPSEGDRIAHYENLYFLAAQLHDDLLDEYDNPAIQPFIRAAVEQVLPNASCRPGNARDEILALSKAAKTHIRTIVSAMLTHAPTRLDHLGFIVEAIQDRGGWTPAILTLNHDGLLDALLRPMELADGFADEANCVGVRQWQSGPFAAHAGRLSLLKLHGGVNWFRFRPNRAQPWLEDYVGVPTAEYSESRMDSHHRAHNLLDSLPIFMIGSWDKLARYTDEVYLEIYYAALQALRLSDVLVVVGYGFGDKGINKLVADWMCRSSKNRLVAVDLRPNDLRERARGAIAGKWQDWLDEKRLIQVEFDLSAVTSLLSWGQIKEALERT